MIDESQGPRDLPGVVVVVVYHLRFGWGKEGEKGPFNICTDAGACRTLYLFVQGREKMEIVWRNRGGFFRGREAKESEEKDGTYW
ncbi:hypothetical protein SAMN05421758_103273 [Salimicrobium salexigens]|uniref:Uncharacterized protein n=1 Tax=Salimicrobium salexigens TaxID=908941 RepID=A0ABY1KQW7_9BACI|nr:hypothetical protein SAMN05421758_103273 [Salimicrobium salexigens]